MRNRRGGSSGKAREREHHTGPVSLHKTMRTLIVTYLHQLRVDVLQRCRRAHLAVAHLSAVAEEVALYSLHLCEAESL